MPPRRVILALTLALAWCWGAWHEDLESAGWMLDHEHHHQGHHEADQSGSHEHTPISGDDHEPVWARSLTNDIQVIPFLHLLFATLAVVGIWSLAFNLREVDAPLRGRPKRRARDFDPIWNFVRRCAPDVAAPPALS
jgi:hypothetical protein